MTETTTKPQPKELTVERVAGKRCDYVVRYTRGGKKYLDGLYAPDEQSAADIFVSFAKELGWKVADVTVEPRAAV